MLMRYIKTSVAVCLAALSLSSCSSDEMATIEETGQSYMAHVTLTASKVTFGNTRSSLNENDPKDGALHFSWDLNDVIYVTDTENAYKGRLVVNELDDAGNATFDGMMEAEIFNGEKDYVFYFLGNNTKIDEKTGQIDSKEYDFSSQDGMLSSLDDDDLLIKQAKMSFKDGEGSVSVVFDRQFAYAHFKLVYDDETLDTHGVPVTISASNLSPKASVDFTNKTIIPGDVVSFTVTPSSNPVPDDENGFYVGLVPNDSETTLTFTCTVNGVDFTGTRTLKKLEKNDFYRLNETNGYKAIPIEMNPVVTNTYHVVYHLMDAMDSGDKKEIISKTYDITGAEATSYVVLDFNNVDYSSKSFARGNDVITYSSETEGFSNKDIVTFLGWGKKVSSDDNNSAHGGKIDYRAGEKINLDQILNKQDGSTLHLYAKSGKIEYNLAYGYNNRDIEKNGKDLHGTATYNRVWGWVDVTTNTTSTNSAGKAYYPEEAYTKVGYEIIGWSRKPESTRQESDEVIPLRGYVRIHKDDDVRVENAQATNPGDKVATVTVTIYPVWKKIENGDVNLNKYNSGTLK